MIAPGTPDLHSLRTALEMGYEVHDDGLWWPIYNHSQYDKQDWTKNVWPAHIHNQWTRLGVKRYVSPDNSKMKEVK